ncbi:MAG: response regulator [Synechococcus sp.]
MTTRPSPSTRTRHPIRSILVEDHEPVRAVVRSVLSQVDGFELAAEFVTGTASLEQLNVLQPDLAIVNIGLPDMDGIELTKQAKVRCPHLLVLILTGSTREESVLEAFSAGADGYCLKEFVADNLVLALEQLNAGHAWIDPAIAHVVLDRVRSEADEPDTVTIAAADAALSEQLEESPLTERELEVLEKIVDGYSNAAIAEEFQIGMGTVKTHVRNLLQKLKASDRTQAAVRALRTGLVK